MRLLGCLLPACLFTRSIAQIIDYMQSICQQQRQYSTVQSLSLHNFLDDSTDFPNEIHLLDSLYFSCTFSFTHTQPFTPHRYVYGWMRL